jgi:hypothetical protein
MKRTPDVELVLRDYFADDGLTAPDYVLDVVEDRISRQPQRRSWRLPWRLRSMSNNLKLVAGAAAAIFLVVVAWQFLPGRPDGPGDTPTATPIPAATPIPSAPPPLAEGILAAGTYRIDPFASATMTIDATVPDGGWLGGPPNAIGGPRGESNGPNGVAVAFLRAQTINSDPCHWDKDGSGRAPQEGDIEVGPTVDDLAEALAGSSAYESTTPVDATLGGFSGKRLELQLAPDPSGCDSYDGAGNQYFVFGGRDGGFFAQGDANRWQITIVDVDGTRLIGVLLSYAETSGEDLTAAQAILDSLVITP